MVASGAGAAARMAVGNAEARDRLLRARAGMTQFQKTAGPFQEGGTFAAWAVGGQVLLSPADAAVAQSFRPTRLPSTVVL